MDILIRMLMAVLKDRKHKKQRRVLSTVLAAVVVFMTTYSLILPAITLEESTAETTDGIFLESADVSEADPADDDVDPSGELLLTDDAREESAPASDGWEDGLIEDADWEENGELADIPDEPALTDTGDETEEAAETETGNVYAETEEATEDTTESEESVGEGETESELEEQYPEVEFSDSTQYTQVKVYAPEGAFPEGTQMLLSDVEDDETIAAICDAALAENSLVQKVHAVDISFRNSRNEEIEPLLPIRVEMTAEKCAEVGSSSVSSSVVHVDDSGNATIVENAQKVEAEAEDEKDADKLEDVETIAFEAKEFSVYALVYTVDFHWEVDGQMYEFSLPGGGFISFSDLIEVLGVAKTGENDDVYLPGEVPGINDQDATGENGSAALTLDGVVVSEKTREFVADVKSVVFSSPELVDVSKVESETTVGGIKESRGLDVQYSAELTEEQIAEINAQTVVAGDWALISVQPFESTESLTVTMKTGEVFEIRVTDAQLKKTVKTASGETWEITITYDDSAEIPKDAELRVEEILPEDERYEQYYQQSLEKISVGEVPDTIEDESGSEMIDETAETASEEAATTTSYAHIFDIQIWAGDQQIEPASGSTVSVSIKLLDAPENEDTNLQVVHFGKDGLEVMELAENNDETKAGGTELNFVTDEFSVYAIIGTETFTEKFLTEDGETYNISVTAGAEAHIPADAHLEISEVKEGSDKYDELFAKAQAAVTDGKDASVPFARFFDIAIVKDGEKIQPDAPVDVKISFDETVEANKNAVFNAVHIADDGENVDVLDVETEGEESDEAVTVNAVQFEAEGFSIYGVTYTVDFETVDGVVYSIPGEGSYKLNDLLPAIIGKEGVVSEASLELVEGEKVEGALYLTQDEVGDWYINSGVAFDDTYLLIMTVDGEKYEIKVTDAQNADITTQLKDATISGTGASSNGNNWKVEDPTGSYNINLFFEETNGSDQFPKLTNGDTELHLTYQLPNGLTTWPQGGQVSFINDAMGTTITFPWTIDASGKITFVLDNTRKDFDGKTAYEVFDAAVSANFKVSISAKWDQMTNKLHFSNNVEKNIEIGKPDPGKITLYKDGWFDENTKKLKYKFTVKTEGGNVDTATITDTLTNATGIKIDRSSIKITQNDWPRDESSYTTTVNDQGMVVRFANLTAGKEYYIEYTADVDYKVLDTDKDGSVDLSPNNKVTDNKTTAEKKINQHVTFTNVTKEVGKESDLIEEGGKQYRELEWKIKVNDSRAADLGGTELKDYLKTSNPPTEYAGNGLTVEKTDAAGNKTTTTIPWNKLTEFNKTTGWTYSFPSSVDKSAYVFTYKTRVDVTNLKGKATIKNEVEGEYGKQGKDGEVTPSEIAEIKKEFLSTADGNSTWKITLTVPSYGLDLGRVDEQVPSTTKDGKTYYDDIVSVTVDESKLVSGEHYVKEDWSNGSGFTMNFYKNAGTGSPGFNSTGAKREIEITVVTKNNQEWINNTSATPKHENIAKFNYIEAKASKNFTKKDVKKSVKVPDHPKTKTINNKQYQVLKYEIELNGVNGTITLNDSMNIEGVIYTSDSGDLWDNLHLYYYENWNWNDKANRQVVSVQQKGKDATISVPITSIPLNAQGEYYPQYKIVYYVYVPIDKIQELAAKSTDLKGKVKNTVDWEGTKRSSEYEASYDGLSKELLNEGELNGNNRIAKYQIKVNTQGALLNGGNAYKLQDTFSDSLAVDYSSIKYSNPDAVLSYEISQNTITIWIKDGEPLTITYNAKVLGEGRLQLKNTAKTEFDEEVVDKSRDFNGGAQGQGSFPFVHLMKVDGDNAKIRLGGVKFVLHSTNPAEEERLLEIPEENRSFITDSDGKVDIETRLRGFDIYFNTEYILKEDPKTVPEDYIPLDSTYDPGITFIVDKDGKVDWSKHQYYNGYTMQVKNWKKKGNLEITKEVVSDKDQDKNAEYSFEIRLYSDEARTKIVEGLSGTFGDVSITAGVGTFSIKHGQKKTINGIPEGIYYEVKEKNVPEEMSVLYDGKVSEAATGRIEYNKTKSVAVKNTKEVLGKLLINKSFSGNAASKLTDAQKALLQFKVTGPDNYSEVFKYGVNNAGKNAVWGENTLTISNLKLGEYTVEETGDAFKDTDGTTDLYIHSKSIKVGANDTAKVTIDADGEAVNIDNKYDEAKLEVTKSVTGLPTTNTEVTYSFTITGNATDGTAVNITKTLIYPKDFTNGSTKFTLTHKDGIRPGTEYTVTETASSANVIGYTRSTTINSNTFKEDSNTDPKGIVKTDESSGAGEITVTNSYEQKTVKLPVSKTWVFANPSTVTKVDGKNWPTGVKVHVVVYSKTGDNEPSPTNHTVDLTDATQSYEFTGLPEYDGKNKIEYSVVETGVTGLDSTNFNTVIEGNAKDGYVIKNTEKSAGLTIIKSFEGSTLTEDEKKAITFTVSGSGLKDRNNSGVSVSSLTKTYKDFVNGQWVLNQLDGIVANGTYTVTETSANVQKYTRVSTVQVDSNEAATFTQNNSNENAEGNTPTAQITLDGTNGTVTITNIYTKEKTEINGTKIWVDKKETHTDPTLVLKRKISTDKEYTIVNGATLTWSGEGNNRTYTYSNLDKYDDNENEYEYIVTENVPEGYAVTYSDGSHAADKGTITNTELTTVTTEKTWGGEAIWPEDITVEFTLSAEGWTVPDNSDGTYGAKTPRAMVGSNDETKRVTWTNLPKYYLDGSDIKEVVYRVSETNVKYKDKNLVSDFKSVYVVAGEGTGNEGKVTIDNKPKTITVSVSKIWDGDDGTDRPEGIEYTLSAKAGSDELTYEDLGLANKEALKKTGLNTGTPPYSASWENLPKYTKAGVKIDYMVTEGSVERYSLVKTKNTESESTWDWEFTNKMVKIEIPGTKKITGRPLDGTDNDKYTFKIEPVTKGAPEFDTSSVNNDTSTGKFKFGPLYITKSNIISLINADTEGDQTINLFYKVTEDTTEKKENIKYDRTEYTVLIPVTYNKSTGAISTGDPIYTIGETSVESIVFENTDITRFDFEKVWKQNDVVQKWPNNMSITVTLKREPKEGSGITAEIKEYTVTADAITGDGFEGSTTKFTGSEGSYRYSITGLPKYWENEDAKGEWKYSISETQVEGYNLPIYYPVAESGRNETPHKSGTDGKPIYVEQGANGVKIENDQITVSLPETGGSGTTPYTLGGSLILAFTALAYIFKKKRGLSLVPVEADDPWRGGGPRT